MHVVESATESAVLRVNATFSVENCTVLILCSFNNISESADEDCLIQFSEDATYENLSPPVQVPINTLSVLFDLSNNKIFYYQVTVTANSSNSLQQRGNFTAIYTGESMRHDISMCIDL